MKLNKDGKKIRKFTLLCVIPAIGYLSITQNLLQAQPMATIVPFREKVENVVPLPENQQTKFDAFRFEENLLPKKEGNLVESLHNLDDFQEYEEMGEYSVRRLTKIQAKKLLKKLSCCSLSWRKSLQKPLQTEIYKNKGLGALVVHHQNPVFVEYLPDVSVMDCQGWLQFSKVERFVISPKHFHEFYDLIFEQSLQEKRHNERTKIYKEREKIQTNFSPEKWCPVISVVGEIIGKIAVDLVKEICNYKIALDRRWYERISVTKTLPAILTGAVQLISYFR